ncbi:MAG: TonB family protein [candidate division Zixibacteria bacterium]|nr:TonB family protein [candidate division Zixibacteria bacterium]
MSRGLLYSFILHIVFFGGALITSPFDVRKKMDLGDVIKVTIKSMPELKATEPVSISPPATPQAIMTDELPDIPLSDPLTVKEKKKLEEKPKPKKEKKKKAEPQPFKSEEPPEKEIESRTTESGSMFAGATVDNRAFDYPYWFDVAFSKVHSNFRNPVSSDAPIVAVVYFEVIQSGRVVIVKIEESSDIERFDDACVRAIDRSSPFPPLPRSFQDEIIGITLPFMYEPH